MAEPSVLEQFAAYPFDTDQAFQEGLSSILDSIRTDSTGSRTQEDIIGRAKAFYFSSITGHRISWEEAQAAAKGHAPSMQQDGSEFPPPSNNRVLSFAEIMTLIESNQAHLVPNNECIPGGTTEDSPSISKAEPRKKPWEASPNDAKTNQS